VQTTKNEKEDEQQKLDEKIQQNKPWRCIKKEQKNTNTKETSRDRIRETNEKNGKNAKKTKNKGEAREKKTEKSMKKNMQFAQIFQK